MNFGPKNSEEAVVFAREGFGVDVQVAIHERMLAAGVNREQLAELLGWSDVRVDFLFDDDADIDVRTFAEVCHALGCRPVIGFEKSCWINDKS